MFFKYRIYVAHKLGINRPTRAKEIVSMELIRVLRLDRDWRVPSRRAAGGGWIICICGFKPESRIIHYSKALIQPKRGYFRVGLSRRVRRALRRFRFPYRFQPRGTR